MVWLGVFGLIGAIFLHREYGAKMDGYSRLYAEGRTAEAVIVSDRVLRQAIEFGGRTLKVDYLVTVEFTDGDGKKHRVEGPGDERAHGNRRGQVVTVNYLPDDPRVFEFGRRADPEPVGPVALSWIPLAVAIVSLVSLIAGAYGYLTPSSPPKPKAYKAANNGKGCESDTDRRGFGGRRQPPKSLIDRPREKTRRSIIRDNRSEKSISRGLPY